MDEAAPGEAHLIEHVVANSPSTIPAPAAPADAKSFDGNALTKPNYTSFVVVVSPNSLERWIHSRLSALGRKAEDTQVYRNEVGRVVAELNRNRAGTYVAYKALHALSARQSPRITDEIAWTQNVPEARVRARIRQFYRPDNAILVVAGDIDLGRTVAIARAAERRLRLAELRRDPPKLAKRKPRAGLSQVVNGQYSGEGTVAGLAWLQPPAASRDFLAFLVADQLLLGGRTDPSKVERSIDSPLATRLKRRLGATVVDDARDSMWGAPPLADLDPSLHVIQFSAPRPLGVAEVRNAATAALRDIRRTSMSEAEIVAARDHLASFYEAWLLEPSFRVLADHLAAFAFTGRDPNKVRQLPQMIRAVTPADVRRIFDRYLLRSRPAVVVLPAVAKD